ncbi:MAG: hypothetical protein Q9166_004871 [cf. Caloplaca sp. 2 TL-2023]
MPQNLELGIFFETSRGLVVIPETQQVLGESFLYSQAGTLFRDPPVSGGFHRPHNQFFPQLNLEAAELQKKVIKQKPLVSSMLPTPVFDLTQDFAEPGPPTRSTLTAQIDDIVAHARKRRLEDEIDRFEASMYRLEHGGESLPGEPLNQQQQHQKKLKREHQNSSQQPAKRIRHSNRQQYEMMSDRPCSGKSFYGGHYLERINPDQQEQYVPLKALGTGGQGTAHLLKTRRTGALVVCKVIPHSRSNQGDQSELSFLRDALPRHSRIVNLRSALVGPFQTQLYLDYCSGGDLASFIDAYHHRLEPQVLGEYPTYSFNHIPESFIWHTYSQLTEALAFIHYGYDRCAPSSKQIQPDHWLSVIHRDIKPGNILLQRDHPGPEPYPKIVLADFGLAKKADYFNVPPTSNEWVGTFIWQPPELPYHSIKGDVWSAGAIIFNMITGYIPTDELPSQIEDLSVVERLWRKQLEAEKVNTLRGTGIQGYSMGLQWCLERALAFAPDRRMGSLQLLCEIEDCRYRVMAGWEELMPWV